MARKSQSGVRLRPVDLARRHGLSTQAVRNYEEAGILPPAARTPTGYRSYTPLHASALDTFLALAPGHGRATAAAILRAVHEDRWEEAYRLVDESHAQLLEDRRTLRAVEDALRDLGDAGPPAGAGAPAGDGEGGGVFVGPLARRLGVRPATLRTWERAGLVLPRRDPRTGYRVYDETAVREARMVHQLRRGGYLLERIAPLMTQVRAAGGPEPLEAALDDWHGRLAARGRALLRGAAELERHLGELGRPPDGGGCRPVGMDFSRPAG
ncbi:TioE family transcriptional regulator [Streptomyces sp. NPDC091377]|uniref:TioE family transcriptional regulator n=1 Tax=Streptomyces sp. NPDC091377 TaxID=3365995 RepID=UPI00380FB043